MFSKGLNFSFFKSKLFCTFLNSKFSTYPLAYKQAGYNVVQITNLTKKFLSKSFPTKSRMVKKRHKQEMLTSSLMKAARERKLHPRLLGLNKIFMEEITSTLAVSDVASQLAAYSVEITRVIVQQGVTSIHVYWTCPNSKDDEIVNDVLVKASTFIRHDLISKQILGKIPPLSFIRDDSYKNAVEIEKLLSIADFGNDFEPCYPIYHQPVPVVKKEISEDVWKRVNDEVDFKNVEEEEPTPVSEYPSDLHPMRQDIFHVDRQRIMDLVKKGVAASKGKHRETDEAAPTAFYSDTQGTSKRNTLFSPLTSHARSSEIRKWASQYKKLRKKTKRKENDTNRMLLYEVQGENEMENGDFHVFDMEKDNLIDEEDFDIMDER